MSSEIIKFVRSKDLKFVKELGQGACGRTVILHDDVIDESFVCKKYSPQHEALKVELFANFVREIKILHLLNHANVVRVFNYYLYPEHYAGYILMEYVVGQDIEDYLIDHPQNAGQVFLQVVEGFDYLEKNGVLHRDIRPLNILVSNDGVTKIIDFGFGKRIEKNEDFDKSITLNWWCDPPAEFKDGIYDFTTEVYFVGKLFEKILELAGVNDFSYKGLLARMCTSDPAMRIASFSDVKHGMLAGKIDEFSFTELEMEAYRCFASDLSMAVKKIEKGAKYFDDVSVFGRTLESAYKSVMLEESVPSNDLVISCLVNGAYRYSTRNFISVLNVCQFLDFFRSCSATKKEIVLSNLISRLNAVPRFNKDDVFPNDDIPF